jgi:excisionase family DNA binding protein
MKNYLNTKQTASHLSISTSTLYKMVMNREIPFVKFNGWKLLFNVEELDKWHEERCTKVLTKEEISEKAMNLLKEKK